MEECNGRGSCIQQCYCSCYDNSDSNDSTDDVIESPPEVCVCGHSNHTKLIGGTSETEIYCQKECSHHCQLVECHNFKLCGKKRPQQVLDAHNDMCVDCAIMIGKIIFMDDKDDCPVCMENKEIIKLTCNHTICLDCWKQMSETPDRPIPLSCPLCRKSIW